MIMSAPSWFWMRIADSGVSVTNAPSMMDLNVTPSSVILFVCESE